MCNDVAQDYSSSVYSELRGHDTKVTVSKQKDRPGQSLKIIKISRIMYSSLANFTLANIS